MALYCQTVLGCLAAAFPKAVTVPHCHPLAAAAYCEPSHLFIFLADPCGSIATDSPKIVSEPPMAILTVYACANQPLIRFLSNFITALERENYIIWRGRPLSSTPARVQQPQLFDCEMPINQIIKLGLIVPYMIKPG